MRTFQRSQLITLGDFFYILLMITVLLWSCWQLSQHCGSEDRKGTGIKGRPMNLLFSHLVIKWSVNKKKGKHVPGKHNSFLRHADKQEQHNKSVLRDDVIRCYSKNFNAISVQQNLCYSIYVRLNCFSICTIVVNKHAVNYNRIKPLCWLLRVLIFIFLHVVRR